MEDSFFDALRSVQRFATKICMIQTINIIWISSIFDCQYEKLCHLYKLVYGLSIFPNFRNTTSSSQSYPTHSNHNLSLHVPSSHTNAYYYSFLCEAVCTWNSLPFSVMSLPSLERTVSNYLQLLLCLYCIVPYSWVHTRTY